MTFRRTQKRIGAVLAATAAFGMVTVGGVSSAGCKARFPNMISTSQEVELGQQAQQDIERKYPVSRDPAVNARMQRIAARVLPHARAEYDVPYQVKVIESKEINAFALPGGPIYFYRGLLDLATDDEVASVLGHEAAHISRRHSAKQISDAQGKSVIASILTQGRSNVVQALANIGLALDQLNYSRGDEAESDEVGFRYYTAAGYDPDAMASFFRKLAEKGGSGGPEWLSSHPLTQSRIQRAEQRAEEYKRGRRG